MSTFKIIDENKQAYRVEFVRRVGNDEDGSSVPVTMHRWVKKQCVKAVDNIINKARKSDLDNKGMLDCRYIAEKICIRFKLKQFFVNGNFSWKLFFATRDTYHNYYNLPMNILHVQDRIIYHKNGKATPMGNKYTGG